MSLNSLNSHHVFLKYGINKTMIAYSMHNHFNIPNELTLKNIFSVYMFKMWEADKVLHLSQKGEGTITFLDTQYLVVYKNTSRGRIFAKLKQDPNLEVALSFRKPQDDIDLFPVVMISEVMVKNI